MKSHSTRSTYQAGCRCTKCRGAHARAAKRYRQQTGTDSLVPIAASQAHVRWLKVNSKAISKVTGIHNSVIDKIRYGLRKYARRSTEKKILALTREDVAAAQPALLVPAEETKQLLLDLRASGFTGREIARKAGVRCGQLAIRAERVRAWNAKRIEGLYRKMGEAA